MVSTAVGSRTWSPPLMSSASDASSSNRATHVGEPRHTDNSASVFTREMRQCSASSSRCCSGPSSATNSACSSCCCTGASDSGTVSASAHKRGSVCCCGSGWGGSGWGGSGWGGAMAGSAMACGAKERPSSHCRRPRPRQGTPRFSAKGACCAGCGGKASGGDEVGEGDEVGGGEEWLVACAGCAAESGSVGGEELAASRSSI